MNETQRVSLERHLQKKFPQWGIHVALSDNGKSISISGSDFGKSYTREDAPAIWSESDRYTLENFGRKIEWEEPW